MRIVLIVLFTAIGGYTQQGAIEKLGFLAGCWAGSGVEEMWTRPAGGTMLGISRTIKGGKTVFTEFLQVSSGAGDTLVLNVQLRLAGKSTQFRATDLKGDAVTFSNPEHDYPQRISYRREPDGSLFARIEGTAGGKARHDDFKYSRVRCSD